MRTSHRRPGHGRGAVAVLKVGLGVHPLLRSDVAEVHILGGLGQGRRMVPGEVADEVKVLPLRSGDTEGLLGQTVWLVTIAIGTVKRVIALGVVSPSVCWTPVPPGIATRIGRVAGSTSFALHLAIGQEAAVDSAGAPGFPVSPSSHARLAFIPDEDGARFDHLTLLLRKAALDAGQHPQAACLEEEDRIRRGLDISSVCFHCHVQAVRLRLRTTWGPGNLHTDAAFLWIRWFEMCVV